MAALRQLRLGVITLGAAGLLLSTQAWGQPARLPAETTWRVVLLNNADFLLPASAIMDQALRETFVRESPHSVEFFGEALDSFRHPRDIDDELHALLRKKYKDVRVDLVMARSAGAMAFVHRHRDELWPGVQVVFYNESVESLRDLGPPHDSTGVVIDLDPGGTIELALRLHPSSRAIYVVGGTSEYDRGWKSQIQPLLGRLAPKHTVTWLDNLPLPRILDAVGSLPPDSVVLYTSVLIDAEGRTRTNPQVAGQVAAASVAPVYGILATYMGVGIVGGAITDFAEQGRAAARLAIRVLRGESAAGIPVQPSPPSRCTVDARAMERFRIDDRLLPTDCEVLYRSPSVWRDYRWYVVGALVAVALQSLLIAALFVQRRRRQRAERAELQQRLELAHSLRLATVGEMTAAISHEINQPLGAILSNADAAEMLLDSDSPSLNGLRQILADIRRDDLRASEVVQRIRALLQRHQAEKEVFDLNELIADTAHLIGAEAARREMAIEVQSAATPSLVHGDRVQLRQLLVNLMINAMDAMADTPPAQRRLTLHTEHKARRKIEITVSDTGHGIEDGTREHLFNSFYTTKRNGLGLGLSIARTVAQAHGGSIRADNNSAGGATFRVLLPEAQPESMAAETGNGEASKAREA